MTSLGNHSARVWLLALLMLAMVFKFQNCTVQQQQHSAGSTGTEQQEPKLSDTLGFGYSVSLDTLAYLSCTSPSPAGDFFTFRAGAYKNGGLEFRQQMRETLAKLNPREVLQTVADSPVNGALKMQASLRPLNRLQSVFHGGSSATLGEDFQTFFHVLGADIVTAKLLGLVNSERLKYIPGNFGQGFRFEVDLKFGGSELLAEDMRDFFHQDNGVLSVNYVPADKSTEPYAFGPNDVNPGSANPDQQVFGRGYKLTFRQPPLSRFGGSTIDINNPKRVLETQREFDLETPDSGVLSSWTCPNKYTFKVVRAQDSAVSCPEVADDMDNADLKVVRRVLRPAHWMVNMDRKCIVARKIATERSCYASGLSSVVYSLSASCTANTVNGDACAHYFSMCVL